MNSEKLTALKKIKGIEIKTRRLVEDYFSGKYQSIFKGVGMNFSDVREYYPGDDIRNIDWNVTARLGKPFVKEFVEERERTVIVAADVSGSGDFGSFLRTKIETICELAAVLAFSALRNQDKIGLVLFSEGVEKYLPPKKNSQYAMRIIREILYYNRENSKTDISKTLKFLIDVVKKRAVIFLISDFIDSGFEKSLAMLNGKHDVIALRVSDPIEDSLPDIGFIELEDSESGERFIVNSSDPAFRREYEKNIMERNDELKLMFGKAKIDYVLLNTVQSYIKPLYAFFKARERRLRV